MFTPSSAEDRQRQSHPGNCIATGLMVAVSVALLLTVCLIDFLAAAEEKAGPKDRLQPAGMNGSLVICGGGRMPEAVHDRFVELAGGNKAHLVIIPTASAGADREEEQRLLEPWKARKPALVTRLHTRSRKMADDPAFVEPLRKATGVWFGGGDQSRITEVYLGTEVEKQLYALLRRGGVIGGTSAGAAVMSRLMITGGNLEARTARGFDLLPDTVIDQHFGQRQREQRLLGVLQKNPGLLGIGIDEATAVIVRGNMAEIMGRGQAHFYDTRKPAEKGKMAREVISSGGRFDLQTRKAVPSARKE